MNNALIPLITAMSLTLFLSVACADQNQDADATAKAADSTTQSADNNADSTTQSADNSADSLMDKPVDFSSLEQAEKTLQNILEQEGQTAYGQVKNALDYLLFYDIGVSRSKDKLYAKLNGHTPNQIIATMKAMKG